VAAIGPSIGPCCYVIDEARAAIIRERLGPDSGDLLFAGPDGRPIFDLWSANVQQLEQAGVRTIERCDICTKSGGADIWSYRGDNGKNGTGLGIIGRPKP
jgi:copper oxidase (laccase) domain-containing protein